MRNIIRAVTTPRNFQRWDRRLAADTSLRRAVLASGGLLSVVCYVLAISAGR